MNTIRWALGLGAGIFLVGCATTTTTTTTTSPTRTAMSGPPAATSVGCDTAALQQSVMRQVNAARASGLVCGAAKLPPARPVAWNPDLAEASARHAAAMARHEFIDHRGRDGSSVVQRARRDGYPARAAGEALAAGDYSPESVVRTWLGSERHCRTVMNPAYTDVGASCVADETSEFGTYWTLVLGNRAATPRAVATPPPPRAKSRAATQPRAKPRAAPSPRQVR